MKFLKLFDYNSFYICYGNNKYVLVHSCYRVTNHHGDLDYFLNKMELKRVYYYQKPYFWFDGSKLPIDEVKRLFYILARIIHRIN